MLFEGEKRLGFGCLRLPHIDPDDTSDVDTKQMAEMVDYFLEKGFKYFDTAYGYLNYKSELFVRETLTSRHPRDSYILTTKLPCLELKEDSDIRALFEEQLKKAAMILSSGSDGQYDGAKFEYKGSFLDYLKLEDMGVYTDHGKEQKTPEKLEKIYQWGLSIK